MGEIHPQYIVQWNQVKLGLGRHLHRIFQLASNSVDRLKGLLRSAKLKALFSLKQHAYSCPPTMVVDKIKRSLHILSFYVWWWCCEKHRTLTQPCGLHSRRCVDRVSKQTVSRHSETNYSCYHRTCKQHARTHQRLHGHSVPTVHVHLPLCGAAVQACFRCCFVAARFQHKH